MQFDMHLLHHQAIGQVREWVDPKYETARLGLARPLHAP